MLRKRKTQEFNTSGNRAPNPLKVHSAEEHTIGTHVNRGKPRESRAPSFKSDRSRPRVTDSSAHLSFSNPRRTQNSYNGSIDQMHVATKGAESHRALKRRKSHKSLAEEKQRKSHKKGLIIAACIAGATVLAAIGVGIYAFFVNTDAKLDLAPSNAPEALTAVQGSSPMYVLCTANIGTWASAPASYAKPQLERAYMLVRADMSTRTITFVTVPINLEVRYADGEYRPLTDALEIDGDAELVRRLSKFFGIDINHFASTTATGLAKMVDVMGGIDIFLPAEIDDPYAGIQVLFAGDRTLNGKQAITFLRAGNLSKGLDDIAENRVDFTLSFAKRALAFDGLAYATLVGDAGEYMRTSLSAADLLALGDSMRPLETATMYECLIPGYETTDPATGKSTYVCYTDEWEPMLQRFIDGEDPLGVDTAAESVVPSEVTVEVRNGTQMNGQGAKMAEILRDAGYNVTKVGNTDDGTIYPETLVVYTDEAYEGAARAIVRDMANGRTVNGGDFYTSDANVISIVGADWTPLS